MAGDPRDACDCGGLGAGDRSAQGCPLVAGEGWETCDGIGLEIGEGDSFGGGCAPSFDWAWCPGSGGTCASSASGARTATRGGALAGVCRLQPGETERRSSGKFCISPKGLGLFRRAVCPFAIFADSPGPRPADIFSRLSPPQRVLRTFGPRWGGACGTGGVPTGEAGLDCVLAPGALFLSSNGVARDSWVG